MDVSIACRCCNNTLQYGGIMPTHCDTLCCDDFLPDATEQTISITTTTFALRALHSSVRTGRSRSASVSETSPNKPKPRTRASSASGRYTGGRDNEEPGDDQRAAVEAIVKQLRAIGVEADRYVSEGSASNGGASEGDLGDDSGTPPASTHSSHVSSEDGTEMRLELHDKLCSDPECTILHRHSHDAEGGDQTAGELESRMLTVLESEHVPSSTLSLLVIMFLRWVTSLISRPRDSPKKGDSESEHDIDVKSGDGSIAEHDAVDDADGQSTATDTRRGQGQRTQPHAESRGGQSGGSGKGSKRRGDRHKKSKGGKGDGGGSKQPPAQRGKR